MSKHLSKFQFSLEQCEKELVEFGDLLDQNKELSEKNELLPFFGARPHLSAFAASWNLHVTEIDQFGFEFDLFGNFRCDWVAGDGNSGNFVLVEIEDERQNSIFGGGEKYHEEWGRRFEHGYSQLVDWFWTLDSYRDNPDFRKRFGNGELHTFSGLLIIGRNMFLDDTLRERLHWRVEKVLINSNKIVCMTFDELRERMDTRIKTLRDIAKLV